MNKIAVHAIEQMFSAHACGESLGLTHEQKM